MVTSSLTFTQVGSNFETTFQIPSSLFNLSLKLPSEAKVDLYLKVEDGLDSGDSSNTFGFVQTLISYQGVLEFSRNVAYGLVGQTIKLISTVNPTLASYSYVE